MYCSLQYVFRPHFVILSAITDYLLVALPLDYVGSISGETFYIWCCPNIG